MSDTSKLRLQVSILSAACTTLAPVIALILAAGISSAQAQQIKQRYIDANKCMYITLDTERIICYDALAKQATVIDQLNSVTDESINTIGLPKQKTDKVEIDLRSEIVALKKMGSTGWKITLKNNQVWRQAYSKRYNLRVGYQVRIYQSSWNESYRLSADKLNSFIVVRRIK